MRAKERVRQPPFSTVRPLTNGSPAEKQLFRIRNWLGWQEVYVMRNRKQKQGFWGGGFDTPWDDFGPVPPPTMDYGDSRMLDDDLQ